ncbi:MAG: ABC transporter permease, partial [Eubacterium sp.]|nr:ABC transporter permease [Eubacterium sp.]
MSILTKSNFRKNKGTSVGLFLLMILTAMMIGVVLLLFLDAGPNAENEAHRLNAGDGIMRIIGNVTDMEDKTISDIIEDDTTEYEITRGLAYSNLETKFGDGIIANDMIISNSDEFKTKMNRTEKIEEDENIKSDYIYLPYQFATSGGYKAGDDFKLNLPAKKYDLKVRGFLNLTYYGCNNTGPMKMILDDTTYDELIKRDKKTNQAIFVSYNLKDGVKATKFAMDTKNELIAVNPESVPVNHALDETLFGKTFMASILAISFLMISIIIVVVIMLMLKSSITNYIRENMQSIGALKAIGYTSKKIRRSMYVMFGILAVFASMIGAGFAYLVMPVMSGVVVGQSGVPYNMKFNTVATVIPVVFVILFTLFVAFLSTRKIKKIEAITALRDGVENHSFKKNRVRLDKTVFGVNSALAFKTTFTNLKQNLITFFVTGLLVFICVVGLMMYENFNRNPKLELFGGEICSGGVVYEAELKDEVYDYLDKRDDVSNIRPIVIGELTYNGEDLLWTSAYEDPSKLNNQDMCYEGEYPVYDNEIALSGKFAKDYEYSIGDEVELRYGNKTYSYLITGLIQSCSNSGREAVVTIDAIKRVADISTLKNGCYFDTTDEATTEKILKDCEDHFAGKNVSVLNFYETMEGVLTTFRSITTVMLVMVCLIAAIVIILILFLMVRTLIYNKRKDYGIYKALGYTSGKLIFQTALSFMPTIILSVAVFSVISYFLANPYMNTIMITFGLMKCTFVIPIPGVIIICAGMILLAFVFAV